MTQGQSANSGEHKRNLARSSVRNAGDRAAVSKTNAARAEIKRLRGLLLGVRADVLSGYDRDAIARKIDGAISPPPPPSERSGDVTREGIEE